MVLVLILNAQEASQSPTVFLRWHLDATNMKGVESGCSVQMGIALMNCGEPARLTFKAGVELPWKMYPNHRIAPRGSHKGRQPPYGTMLGAFDDCDNSHA